jgi:hypothetical protein
VSISHVAPAGVAGAPINLAISLDEETGPVGVTLTGVPSGFSLGGGTSLGNGTWTAQTTDPSALAITPPATFTGAVVLGVTENWTNADGSAGSNSFADNVEAYAPGNPIFALSSDDTLTGGGGNDTFVFAQPIGSDRIDNFNAASDTIDLIGFGISGYAGLQGSIADDGKGNAVITLGPGESITLVGVATAALSASNFAFDQEPVTNNTGTMTIGDGAVLPLGGTIDNTGTIAINSTGDESDLEILIRGATLTGGGKVVLSDDSQNVVFGADASAVLDNVDNTISGAGQIGQGQLTLTNEAGGLIDASGASALVIDTGANAIANAGTLEATGAGGLVIDSALSNSGGIWANGGNVTVGGAVSGAGSDTARISGGATLEFGAASNANVSFDAGATGTLKLDRSSSFSGALSGFAAGDALDLADIAAGANAVVSYTANADGSGGTLTVSDGTTTAKLSLLGQFAAGGFRAAADTGVGTIITYEPPQDATPQVTKPTS